MNKPNTTPNTDETRIGSKARYSDQQWLATEARTLGSQIESFLIEVERDGLIVWSKLDARALQTSWLALQEIARVIKTADLPEE
jgi:hypothetical protein